MQSDVIAVSTSHLRPYLLDNLIQHKITEPVFPVIREIKVVRVEGHEARVLLAERPNRACPAVHFRVEAAPVGVIQRHFPNGVALAGVNQHTAAQGVVIVAQRAGSRILARRALKLGICTEPTTDKSLSRTSKRKYPMSVDNQKCQISSPSSR